MARASDIAVSPAHTPGTQPWVCYLRELSEVLSLPQTFESRWGRQVSAKCLQVLGDWANRELERG